MIEVATLTTVFKRPVISSFHFRWMNSFQKECWKLGIIVKPFYVLSEDDPYKNDFTDELDHYRHQYTIQPRLPLSNKSQAGLEVLKDTYEVEYLMHLDSDEILSMELMKVWKELFEKEVSWFGSKACYFVHMPSRRSWEFEGYPNHPIKNGGACIHRRVLDRASWLLWHRGRNSGLNNLECSRLEKIGYRAKVIDTQEYFGVVEIKGGTDAIHPMRWFRLKDLITPLGEEARAQLKSHHPMLEELIQE